MQKRIAILEIGGSHDECILSQLIGLKESGAWIVFCGTKEMFEKNSRFQYYSDEFHEVVLPKSMFGDFFSMVRLNKWFVKNKIDCVIANTAQGGHIRNLCLTASSNVKFFGIIHTIKLLKGSFTQRLISKKIKDYFVLNDTLKRYAGEKNGINIHSFYPLSYPNFYTKIDKPEGECWISVIGGVEYRRKDLNGFVEMVKTTEEHVHFYFLGKSNRGSDEVKQFEKHLKESNLSHRVHLFNDFMNEDDFDAYLKQTDGILPLVHPNTPSAGEYFSRQISGAINVAFSYKIPMMIHERYQDWEDFGKGVIFYNSETFEERFQQFQENIPDLKEQLKSNSKLSPDFQNQRFAEIVLK